MSEATYKRTWDHNLPHLDKTNFKLCMYLRKCLKVLGAIKVDVVCKDQKERLPIIVVAGDGPTLLGRNWLAKIRLNWNKLVHKVGAEKRGIEFVPQKHSDVIKEGLGLVKGYSAKIHVSPKAPPKFCKAGA